MADLTTLLSKFLNDLYAGTLGVTLPITAVRVGNGTVAAPAVAFASETGLGLFRPGAGYMAFGELGNMDWAAGGGNFIMLSTGTFGWGSTTNPYSGTFDTSVVRVSAGVMSPSVNHAFGLASTLLVRTAPTVTSAGTSPSVTASNGSATFRVNVGTGGVATTIVLAMPAATTGWNATAVNLTGAAANRAAGVMVQQSSTTTSITLQYQTLSTGVALAFTASDIVAVSAMAF